MEKIRVYEGVISLCGSCGQPCYDGEAGLAHFAEQWDGVFCPRFPLAGERLEIRWDAHSLETLKEQYPDTFPRVALVSQSG